MNEGLIGAFAQVGLSGLDSEEIKSVSNQNPASDFISDEGQSEGSWWNILDSLKEPVSSAIATAVNAYGDDATGNTGAESTQTSIADVSDQHVKGQVMVTPSFFEQNKMMILGGGAVAALALVMIMMGK